MKSKALSCAVAALLAVGAAIAVPASATAQVTPQALQYRVAKRVCSTPPPGERACFAMKLVPAEETDPGARLLAEPAALHGPHGGFAPADLAAAYGYDPAVATEMTVAIVDAYDNPRARADLNAFNAHYGLPAETATSFRKVNQAGNALPLPRANRGWAVEISLDIQAARAVCNECRILLVEADSASSGDLARAVNTAVRLGADVVSNSYGGPEQKFEPLWVRKAYDHPGVVVTAATGDNGWYSWDRANEGSTGWSYNKPNSPAAYPSVVAVTGTRLTVKTDGTRAAERVWNANGPHNAKGLSGGFWTGANGASGGGCSTQYAAPTWQSAAAGFGDTGCGTKRMVGDVAAVGDPATGLSVYNSYRNGTGPDFWMVVGGTSLSSPLIAAMWALAGGAGSERYPAKSLYDRLKYTPDTISDITLGSNAFCGGDAKAVCSAAVTAQVPSTGNPNNLTNGNHHYFGGWTGLLDCGYKRNGSEGTVAADTQCNAAVGFDGPSGVGAPAGLTLFQPTRITLAIDVPAALELDTEQTWAVSDVVDGLAGATVETYKWTWGDGSPATTVPTESTTHTFTEAGTYKVTVTATDDVGQQASASQIVTVGVAPEAVITGPTTVRVGQSATWRSKNSIEFNTGGSIVARTWFVDAQQVATSLSYTRTFNRTGSHVLKLRVVDNAGLIGTRSITVQVVR